MIVLSETSDRAYPTASARDIAALTEAARLAGCRVVYIPPTFADCGTAEAALAHVAVQDEWTHGVWIGYIPLAERYAAIHEAALARRIRLLNDPGQFQLAMEFDRSYPQLRDLTPRSIAVHSLDECAGAAGALGFPIFVKGAVKSRKGEGWSACVADTREELAALVLALLAQEHRSSGRAILRTLVRLRHARRSDAGFPFGREYRVFLYRGRVLAHGYYWEGEDPLRALSVDETEAMLRLAVTAAQRLDVPYLIVDVGQLESGDWTIIEVGDAQFAGHNDISTFALWNNLIAAVDNTIAL